MFGVERAQGDLRLNAKPSSSCFEGTPRGPRSQETSKTTLSGRRAQSVVRLADRLGR
jgi:hypothetical protein